MLVKRIPRPRPRRIVGARGGDCSNDCPLYDFKISQDHTRPKRSKWSSRGPLTNRGEQAGSVYSVIKDWQTRVIRLHPGVLGKEIQADLIVVDLILAAGVVNHGSQEKLSYEALSYCWGEPIFNCSITLDHQEYPVTEHLYGALQYLRRSDEYRYLWIDALCINQHNLEERSTQVRQMVDVFKKASNVVVWLGHCDEDTRLCMEYISSNRVHGIEDDRDLVAKCCVSHAVKMLNGLKRLLSRPWYFRLWIRQEIWAARSVEVLCGDHSIPWNWLQALASIAGSFGERLEPQSHLRSVLRASFNGLQQADPIALALVEYPKANAYLHSSASHLLQPVDLVSVIQNSVHCRCSDNRDRIYGVLGMTYVGSRNNPDLTKMPIDYNRPTAQVFQDAAKYLMWSDNGCAVLSLEAQFGGFIDGLPLPSWCPNWAAAFTSTWYASRRGFSPSHESDDVVVRFEHSMLHLRACQVASIDTFNTMQYTEDRVQSYGTLRLQDSEASLRFTAFGKFLRNDVVIFSPSCYHLLVLRPLGDGAGFSFAGCLNVTVRNESSGAITISGLTISQWNLNFQMFNIR